MKEKKKVSNEESINAEIEQLKGELEIAQNTAKNWENKFYMAYADMENLRKSYERDHRNIQTYRAMGFLEKLMPILDGFHMALQMEVKDDAVKNYLVGFEFLYKQMIQVLDEEGVKEIATKVGVKFDEKQMHAIDVVEDEGEPNIVKQVVANGYILKDRIIRPTMVVVSKRSDPIKEEPNKEKLDENADEQNCPNQANA